jgi:cytochrome c peroxidase
LHPVEMGFFSKEDLVKRVNSKSYYRTLFQEAFGHDSATVDEIAIALASFIANFEPRNTKSSGLENNLSAARGEELFVEVYRCDRCHRVGVPDGYLFGGSSFNGFSDIGLENNSGDKGLGNVTNRASDNGKFKIPSLTNIALTAPYMHDGRFKTLDEVIEHYSIGVKGAENLDPILKDANGDPIKLNITPQDAQDIIAFLHTLTDFNFINDKRFSDPFKPTK